MRKAFLEPTADQTFEVVGDGPYNFVQVLERSRRLQESGDVEGACNERFQAFQRLAALIPDDEELNLEWSHRNSRAALELIRASAIDHFLINDFEMSAALLELLLELDPEDHLEGSELLAFDYLALDEQEHLVGMTNLRHRLNDYLLTYGGHIGYSVRPSERQNGYATQMLRLTLEKAKERDIEKVRICCDHYNVASAKTIRANGGVLEDEQFDSSDGTLTQRYWIRNK